ncbi:DUF6973 domain-containing protein [Streptomyces lavendulocolor]|uniref:DUF6973 domain-containing protein n=1 Tax=Streptomyces lavendulocolor TaxID=67316 RepID=UPI003F4D44A9
MNPGYGYDSAPPRSRTACGTRSTAPRPAMRRAQDWHPDSTRFQDTGDSLRHCSWNARMEIRLSTTDAHEPAPRNGSTSSGVDKQMDLKNNATGREIGPKRTGQNSAGTRARDDCRSARRNGTLWTIKSSRLMRSNQ